MGDILVHVLDQLRLTRARARVRARVSRCQGVRVPGCSGVRVLGYGLGYRVRLGVALRRGSRLLGLDVEQVITLTLTLTLTLTVARLLGLDVEQVVEVGGLAAAQRP